MITSAYIFGFLLSVLALAGWFLMKDRTDWSKNMRWLLLAGLVVYLGGVAVATAPPDYKLSILFRDLMVIAGIGLLFTFAARKRPALFFALISLLIVLGWFYRNKLRSTFPYLEASALQLDPSGELLIELAPGMTPEVLGALSERFDLRYEAAFKLSDPDRTDLDDYYVVDVPDEMLSKLPEIEAALAGYKGIEWMEPNEIITIDPSPGQRLPDKIGKKFGINDPGLENLWGFEAMEIDRLFTILGKESVQPAQKALIAILDTGIDAAHEDINGNYRSTAAKYDNDPQGHGTHCAGIAAAVSNNGVGVASFSRNNEFVEVTSIKVLSSFGSGTQRSIINGMLEAADKGASVISMSLGGRSNQSRQKAYEKAVRYANDAGTIVVAAAGNSNTNAKDFAPVNAAGIIGVAAIDEQLQRAVFSNYVSDLKMGVAAPGVNIYSTIPNDKYATFNGTSMATPYVAGMIGLMKAIKPELTTSEAYRILNATGKDTQSTRETGKLINPAAAVGALIE